jgi:GDP-L-fucose synthase
VSRLNALGWRANTPLAEGLRRAYAAFVDLMAAQEKQVAV